MFFQEFRDPRFHYLILTGFQLGLIDPNVGSPHQKHFDEKESAKVVLEKAAMFAIPGLQRFVHSGFHEVASQSFSLPQAVGFKTQGSCVAQWAAQIQGSPLFVETNPTIVRKVIDAAGLANLTVVEELMAAWLTSPKQTASLFNRTSSCLAANPMMEKFACRAQELGLSWNEGDAKFQLLAYEAMHVAIVLEELTARALQDVFLASKIFQHIFQNEHGRIMAFMDQNYQGADREFRKLKWQGVAKSVENRLFHHHLEAPLTKEEALMRMKSLELNIAEAARMDLGNGNLANLVVGLSLMADVHVPPSGIFLKVGKAWADSYVAWNAAYVLNLGESSLLGLMKLFIPSVSCTDSEHAEDFIISRIFSLALMISAAASEECPGRVAADMVPTSLIHEWGLSNLQHLLIPIPEEDHLEETLHGLCLGVCARGQLMTGRLSDDNFRSLMMYLTWITVS